jgi:hypothetical protein
MDLNVFSAGVVMIAQFCFVYPSICGWYDELSQVGERAGPSAYILPGEEITHAEILFAFMKKIKAFVNQLRTLELPR